MPLRRHVYIVDDELRVRDSLALLGSPVERLPSKLIARQLGMSSRTTEHHRAAIKNNVQARSFSQLVGMALRLDSGDAVRPSK